MAFLTLVLGAAPADAAYHWVATQTRNGGVAYSGTYGDCDYIYDVLLSSANTWGHAYTMTTSSCTAGRVRHYYFNTVGWAGWTVWHVGLSGNVATTESTHNVQYSQHAIDD